jgi:hypothetical protein
MGDRRSADVSALLLPVDIDLAWLALGDGHDQAQDGVDVRRLDLLELEVFAQDELAAEGALPFDYGEAEYGACRWSGAPGTTVTRLPAGTWSDGGAQARGSSAARVDTCA